MENLIHLSFYCKLKTFFVFWPGSGLNIVKKNCCVLPVILDGMLLFVWVFFSCFTLFKIKPIKSLPTIYRIFFLDKIYYLYICFIYVRVAIYVIYIKMSKYFSYILHNFWKTLIGFLARRQSLLLHNKMIVSYCSEKFYFRSLFMEHLTIHTILLIRNNLS